MTSKGQSAILLERIEKEMKRLNSIENDTVQLEVGECDCGYHFGVDATYLDQVGDFIFKCPSCGKAIDTAKIFDENDTTQTPYTVKD